MDHPATENVLRNDYVLRHLVPVAGDEHVQYNISIIGGLKTWYVIGGPAHGVGDLNRVLKAHRFGPHSVITTNKKIHFRDVDGGSSS